MEFYNTLDSLLNPSQDLGGGPNAADAGALAQLILGGGQASMGGEKLLGTKPAIDPVDEAVKQARMGGFGRAPDEDLAQKIISGEVQPGQVLDRPIRQTALAPASVDPAAAATSRVRNSNLADVLTTADQIAGSLGSPNAKSAGQTITSSLLPNPYGPGSYDPNDPAAVAQVKAAGEKQAKVSQGMDAIKMLRGEAPTVSINHQLSPGEILAFQQGNENYRNRLDSTKDAVKGILENLGLGENVYQKEFDKARGKAAGTADSLGGQGGLDTIAKQLVEGRLPISALGRYPADQKTAIYNKAQELDPKWDFSVAPARQKMREQFASKSGYGGNIASLNTAIHHLDKAWDSVEALANGGVPLWNAIKNKGLENVGDPKVTKAKSNIIAITDELATVFKGTAGTDQQINHWKEALKTSQSPEQFRENFKELLGLMSGRLDALNGTWESTMGSPRDIPILDKKAKATLEKRGLLNEFQDKVAGEGAAGAAPEKAVAMLKSNPTPEMKQFFKSKFGYLPEGM